MADVEEQRAITPSVRETNGNLTEETGHTGEPQSEEELERLIDKELEDVGKDESEDEKEKRLDAQQREIDEELRKLREELEMDSTSPDDMSPEYDIAARVKLLNEELAKEGPIEEKKNRKVNFPENVISMAVPPAEYPEQQEARDGEKGEGKEEGIGQEDGESVLVNGEGEERPQQGVREGWGNTENGVTGSGEAEQRQDGSEIQKRLGSSGGQEDVELVSPSPSETLSNSTDQVDSGKPSDVNSVAEQKSIAKPQPVVSRESTEDGAMPQDNQKDTPSSSDVVDGPVTGSDSGGNASSSSDPNDLEVERLTLRPKVQNNRMLGQNGGQSEGIDGTSEGAEEEFVLVERGGKFYHVHVNDLSAEERYFLGLENSQSQSSKNGSDLPPVQPTPPQKPRPSTATGGGSRAGITRQSPRRVMSAKTQKEYDRQERQAAIYEEPFGNPRSRYGMTPEQKEHRREQARLKMQRMKEEKEREEQERREKEELSEAVFKAWVDKKKEEIAQRKKEEREKKKASLENKEERFPEEAFKAWLDRKKEQKKSEEKVKQQLSEEQRQAYFMRSREDCERAFKEWKRSKSASLRETQSRSRAGALESKKRARQSRKSRNLAKALEVAQNYRYTEYYGYRL